MKGPSPITPPRHPDTRPAQASAALALATNTIDDRYARHCSLTECVSAGSFSLRVSTRSIFETHHTLTRISVTACDAKLVRDEKPANAATHGPRATVPPPRPRVDIREQRVTIGRGGYGVWTSHYANSLTHTNYQPPTSPALMCRHASCESMRGTQWCQRRTDEELPRARVKTIWGCSTIPRDASHNCMLTIFVWLQTAMLTGRPST